jgi:hypothetical protein
VSHAYLYLSIWPLSSLFEPFRAPAIIFRLSYCIKCGSRLEEAHRFCWNCGTARPQSAAGKRPEPEASPPRQPDYVTMIAIVSAASAVMFLVLLAQTAALVLNPTGRDTLTQVLVQAGVAPADRPAVLLIYEVSLVLFSLFPAILHGAAYYGLTARRKAGWVLAFVLSVGWSLLLVGIPFAYLLWRRDTREAFGIS